LKTRSAGLGVWIGIVIALVFIVVATGFDKPAQLVAGDGVSCTYYKNFAVKVIKTSDGWRTSFVRYGKPAVVPLCNDEEWYDEKVLDLKGTVAGAFDDFLVVENEKQFAVYDTKTATRVLKDARVGALGIDKAKLRYRRVVRLPCDDISEQACRQRVEALTGVSVDIQALCKHDAWKTGSVIAYDVTANRGDFDPHASGSWLSCEALPVAQ
jgi:hypothetical protein